MPLRKLTWCDCAGVRTLVQMVSTCLLATASCIAQVDVEKSFLPGFDYWSLTAEVTRNQRIAEELDISPAQVQAIENLRGSKHMHDAFSEKSDEVSLRQFRERRNAPSRGLLEQQSPMELGILESADLVKAELSKILEEKQIQLLRPVAMRQKYRYGYSPFNDYIVVEFCDVSQADQSKLVELVDSERERFDKEIKDVRIQLGSEIVASLPAQSQKRFACYVGDAYLPGFRLPLDFDLTSIPFRKDVVLALGAFETICESPELRAKVGLSQQQCKRLLDAFEEREKALTAAREGFHKNYVAIFMRTHDSCVRLFRDTLTSEQSVTVCQYGSLKEFNSAFEAPFSRHEVLEFLQLSNEEATAVKVLAKEKQTELREKVTKMNKATFDSLCNTLPKSQQETFRTLFADVY